LATNLGPEAESEHITRNYRTSDVRYALAILSALGGKAGTPCPLRDSLGSCPPTVGGSGSFGGCTNVRA